MEVTAEQFAQLVRANRSYRRFDESADVSEDELRALIELARQTPSGMNRQPLKYVLSSDREMNARIFSTLAWAGSLKDWPGPAERERPAAYIVVLVDGSLHSGKPQDVGIAAQTILLGAVTRGFGGCMLGAVNRKELASILALPEELSIELVIALGKPTETVVLEETKAGGEITYYRKADGTHHVPKRPLSEIIVGTYA